jgi:hypothetical protein
VSAIDLTEFTAFENTKQSAVCSTYFKAYKSAFRSTECSAKCRTFCVAIDAAHESAFFETFI